jgi:hypothetical protein
MLYSATLGAVCALLLPFWYWAFPVAVIQGLNRYYRFVLAGGKLRESIVRSLLSERDGTALDPRDAFNLDTMPPDIFASKEACAQLMLRGDASQHNKECRARALGLGFFTVFAGSVGIGIVAIFRVVS